MAAKKVKKLTDAEIEAAARALDEERRKKANVLTREPELQELLVHAYHDEVEARQEHGSEAEIKERAFIKRITKAGYADRIKGLTAIESLFGLVTFMNMDKLSLERRRNERARQPHMEQGRCTGIFETNMYLMDLVNRQNEAASRGRASPGALSRSSSRGEDSFKNGGQAGAGAPATASSSEPVKRRGYNKGFVELVTGMSFFNLEKIAHLAANDFLKNPTMMICAYLEFAAAAHQLARSGTLSTATSKLIKELAETIELTPAACLDYFDATYTKSDPDGEYAGFAPSGHLLRNESIVNASEAEYANLPYFYTQPLSIIRASRPSRRVKPPS